MRGLKVLVEKSCSKRILKKKLKTAGPYCDPLSSICEGVSKTHNRVTKIKK